MLLVSRELYIYQDVIIFIDKMRLNFQLRSIGKSTCWTRMTAGNSKTIVAAYDDPDHIV